MAEPVSGSKMARTRLVVWRKRNRFPIQSIALVVALLAPFGLYWALEGGSAVLAAVFFGLLALALAVTAWIG